MSLSSDGNQGYLDIRNAILRVGTLDVYGITGVDQVTNVVKQNSVLIWDDQGSDMSTPPFQKGAGVARSTTPPEINLVDSAGNNFMYQGLKLPNSWQGEFDLYFADASAGAINCHFYTTSTTSYADDGYELAFDRENSTVTLRYDATQVAQATGVTLSTQWHTASVTFNRGAWAVALDGDRILTLDDDERSAVYDNTTGQYVRFETAATTDRKVRYIKFLNNGAPWLESNAGHLYNLSGNVAVGLSEDDYRFSVAGTANLGATTVTSVAVGDTTDATSTSTGALTVQGLGVASNLHATNVYATNVFVGTHTEPDAYDLSVQGTANTGALTATSIVVGDSTEATSTSTGALQAHALGVTSNIHTNNVYADFVETQNIEAHETLTVAGGTLRLTDGLSNAVHMNVTSRFSWTENVPLETKLTPSDGGVDNYFSSMHKISKDGGTLAVGSYGHNSVKGAVYVYEKSGTAWSKVAKLTASDGVNNDALGVGVSVSADGSIVCASSPEAGKVYVFLRPSGGWANTNQEDAQLTPSDWVAGDYLHDISISSDGTTIVAGTYLKNSGQGAAYVFVKPGSGWADSSQEDAKLLASDGASGDQFGRTVDISGDGSTALIGAYRDDDQGTWSGTAFVFVKPGSGWTDSSQEDAKLTGSKVSGYDLFGLDVAISDDGNTILIGGRGFDDTGVSDTGIAYIFYKGSSWSDATEDITLRASSLKKGDFFGDNTALSADGTIAVVGSYLRDHGVADTGAAFVFQKTGSTWSEVREIRASDPTTNDWFGFTVSVSGDGNTVVASSHTNDEVNTNTGAVYVYDSLPMSDLNVSMVDSPGDVVLTGGGLDLTQVSNVAQIKSSSNVVVQFEKTRRLVKYPRVKMATDDESSTTGYVASASSYLTGAESYKAFDGNYATYWHSQYPYYNSTSGVYEPGNTASGTGTPTGTLPTTELITQQKGEYITLKLEHRIQVKEVHIYPRLESTAGDFSTQLRSQAPQVFVVVGSNTGLAGSWEVLHSVARLRWTQTPNAAHQFSTWSVGYSMNNRMPIIIDVENDGQYRYVGLITKAIKYNGGQYALSISQLHFLGHPEHDPDSNGTDVVIKHKASKPFCADGNDPSLKLYYEPRNWTGGNILVDETSNGRDATLNKVIHHETPAAFEWTGADTSNIYLSNHGLGTGDVVFSIAFWFCKTKEPTHTGAQYIFKLGTGGTLYQSVLWWGNSSGDFTMDMWGQYTPARYNFSINRWYHVCLQHAGGYANDPFTNRIFINGERISTAHHAPGTLGQMLNLQGSTLQFGYGFGTPEHSHAKLGNFRIYNRVLTEHEIWQLFAMDREHYLGANLPGDIVLKNGRVGIGTSEPRAMLDVAGLATFDRIRIRNVPFCIVCPTPNDGAWISANPSANLMPFGDVMSTSADRPWDDTNLRFVCPVKGVYRAMASVLVRGTGNDTLYIYHNYTNTQDVYGHANFNGYDMWHSIHSETLIDCEAGDTIQFYAYASGSWYRGRHTYALVHQVA